MLFRGIVIPVLSGIVCTPYIHTDVPCSPVALLITRKLYAHSVHGVPTKSYAIQVSFVFFITTISDLLWDKSNSVISNLRIFVGIGIVLYCELTNQRELSANHYLEF